MSGFIEGYLSLDLTTFTTSNGDNNDVSILASRVRIITSNDNDSITGITSNLLDPESISPIIFITNGNLINNLILKHSNNNSSSNNQFYFPNQSDYILKPTFTQPFGYAGGKWRPIVVGEAFQSGRIEMFGGNVAPSNWLLCDGSAISRIDYAGLFSAIGTTYGIGDGSTTFNIPDLRQRFPLGKSLSGTGSNLGDIGGNIDHMHSVNPPSTSTTSNGLHDHGGITGIPSATVDATILSGGAASTTHTHSISPDGSHAHDIDIASFNSGTENPPFLTINFIIKI